jgi:hypothetical protein
LLAAFILYTVKDIETATSDFAGLGVVAIPAIFVYAVFNTSFPEELLFRGFLLKRLSFLMGYKKITKHPLLLESMLDIPAFLGYYMNGKLAFHLRGGRL